MQPATTPPLKVHFTHQASFLASPLALQVWIDLCDRSGLHGGDDINFTRDAERIPCLQSYAPRVRRAYLCAVVRKVYAEQEPDEPQVVRTTLRRYRLARPGEKLNA